MGQAGKTSITYIGDGDGGENITTRERPEPQRVGKLRAKAWLQDADRNDKVQCEDDDILKVDSQPVRRELFGQDTERALDILRPLVHDVEVLVGLNEAAGAGANRAAHVRDEEATLLSQLFGPDRPRCDARMSYPSGFARISSTMELRMSLLLFRSWCL